MCTVFGKKIILFNFTLTLLRSTGIGGGKIKKVKHKRKMKKQTPNLHKVRRSSIAPKKKVIKRTKRTTQKPSVRTVGPTPAPEELPQELRWLRDDPHELLLSRFVVTPKDTPLGESIGIDKSMIILKHKSKFYSIPLKSIKEKGDKLVLHKKVNWKRAERLGEHWRKKTLDVMKVKKVKKPKTIKSKKIVSQKKR